MITIVLVGCMFLLLALTHSLWQRQRTLRREAHIRNFELPKGLFDKLRVKRPELTLKECQLVAHGLRQFFLAHLKSGRRFVSMPSQAADDLWHEFILYTRNYKVFCDQAFGSFLHHSPAVVLGSAMQSNEGLKRVWWQSCKEEHINPTKPTRLPLLFALDSKLGIADGFRYQADCGAGAQRLGAGGPGDRTGNNTIIYCGAEVGGVHIERGTGSGCGGGCGGGGHSSSDSDGGGSGDAGGGCGGGGCGS
jgi:hypothetical protein